MAQIARQRDAEIEAGEDIIANYLDEEFDALYSESNSQDTRITSLESGTATISGNKTYSGTSTFSGTMETNTISERTATSGVTVDGLLIKDGVIPYTGYVTPYIRTGPRPTYTSAATITIPSGQVVADSTNTYIMKTTSDIVLDLSASGANGLDTSTEATGTIYYVYLVSKVSDVTDIKAVFSVTNEANTGSITYPSGYDIKRQLPLAVYNGSSGDIIPFDVLHWGTSTPFIQYNVWQDATGSGPTNVLYDTTAATTYTDVTLTYVPEISRMASIMFQPFYTGAGIWNIREDGQSHDGREVLTQTAGNFDNPVYKIPCSASQVIEYKGPNSGADVTINVDGYYVTEVA